MRVLSYPRRCIGLSQPEWLRSFGPGGGAAGATPSSCFLRARGKPSTAWITTGDAWWHNLEGGAPVDMRVSGRWQSAHGVAVTDRATSVFEHERLFREHPWFRRLSGIPAIADGEPDTRAIDRALDAGRTLVRVELDARSPTEA